MQLKLAHCRVARRVENALQVLHDLLACVVVEELVTLRAERRPVAKFVRIARSHRPRVLPARHEIVHYFLEYRGIPDLPQVHERLAVSMVESLLAFVLCQRRVV